MPNAAIELHDSHVTGIRLEGSNVVIDLDAYVHMSERAPARRGRQRRGRALDEKLATWRTLGCLDESDMPPWDTWVAYVDPHPKASYLVAWVPPAFLESVGRAVEVNAYGALYWLRGSKLLLADIFDEEELLV